MNKLKKALTQAIKEGLNSLTYQELDLLEFNIQTVLQERTIGGDPQSARNDDNYPSRYEDRRGT